ncbi:MAG: RluA family pseudouridine synthase [Crocinitomicaceae bacterium]|nr:RluA family pseudouridine synthase [Crocinitomicaceae bacterium]MCF8433899.1 RluA family pseudouridine synthase [Crocinitomicaceae bacterium]
MHSDLKIIFEDNHVIVVNKKASEIVQGDKTGDETMPDRIKTYLKEKYQKPGNVFCGVVHRLDRPTSGAVVFARTSKALERLNAQFREKETNKVYWAIVESKPAQDSGTLVHYLKKNEKQNKSYATVDEVPSSKKAILHYKLIGSSDKYFLLEIELETGRHHQIRVQLSTIGCRIKGDVKYGAKRPNPDGSISLHARTLEFNHPTSKETLKFTAPVPNDPLWLFFEEGN